MDDRPAELGSQATTGDRKRKSSGKDLSKLFMMCEKIPDIESLVEKLARDMKSMDFKALKDKFDEMMQLLNLKADETAMHSGDDSIRKLIESLRNEFGDMFDKFKSDSGSGSNMEGAVI
jgi:DNA mismatch repair ATPase MutS